MFVFEAPTFWFCLSPPRNFLKFVEKLGVSSAFRAGSLKSSLITRLWKHSISNMSLKFESALALHGRARIPLKGEGLSA